MKPLQNHQVINIEASSKETKVLSAHEGIKKAQDFFKERGFSLTKNGTLEPPFTRNQLDKLKARKDSVLEQSSGSLMPTEEDFYQDVLLAVSLYPQRQNGQVQYLFGRGAGIEIALRGEIQGRNKNERKFSYRGHSDFDLYGVDYNVAEDSLADLGGKPVYTPEFQQVFGNQEVYPLKATKAFHSTIPGRLLHETAETLDLGGVSVFIPELEILVLDKLLTPEATPRREGLDAFVLAVQYDLDRQKMLDYYERFVVEPEKGSVEVELNETADSYLGRFQRRQNNLIKKVMQRDGISQREALQVINDRIQYFLDYPEIAKEIRDKNNIARREIFDSMTPDSLERLRKYDKEVSSESVIAGEVEPEFVDPNLWVPLSTTDLNEEGKIVSVEYKSQVLAKIKDKEEPEIRRKRGRKVLDFFAQVDRAKAA